MQIAFLMPMAGSWNVGNSIAGAIIVALDKISTFPMDINIKYTWADDQCSASGGLAALTRLLEDVRVLEPVPHYSVCRFLACVHAILFSSDVQKTRKPDVVIGPGCSSACESTGVLDARTQHANWILGDMCVQDS